MTHIVIRHAEIAGTPGLDLRLRDGRIAAIGPSLLLDGADEVIDADGAAVIPGLHDHHVHLHAAAAAAASARCGPPYVDDPQALARELAAAPGDEHGWVRGVGYIETVAGDLDAAAIDVLHAERPVRIQHRSGALWMLNTAALTVIRAGGAPHPGVERDPAGNPTGRIWRADGWLRERLPPVSPPPLNDLAATLTASGITGVTDATPDLPDDTLDALVGASVGGAFPQRLYLLGVPLAHSGSALPGEIGVGPYKLVLADSALPSLDDLVERIRRAHRAGRAVAVHCVSREALVLLLAAFDITGHRPGDRVEHAALVPADLITDIRRHGLRVVTQPGFLRHRGDYYLAHVEPADRPDLYRCRTLADAGVPVALSSDAPYGPLDPWLVISAAVHRTTASGVTMSAPECLTPMQALTGYLAAPDDPGGPPRRIRVGSSADLVLLRAPLGDVLRAPSADAVRTTFIAGRPM
ncbi:amidohydrolase [Nocardia cyriacigeorgica]|uniref:Amidohydrolase n=1 Tax=Nocardia cyriacigeorgica TaxID=135487 RepID=A0A5R8PBC3_9NOCA|nr:amidohydrolase family protein [Nocardia cyriacigeorgica]TLG05291.1 amidohydrolase [Nocardia cyriacigeorgica]